MAPVSQRRSDQSIEIRNDLFHRLAFSRRNGGQFCFQVSRLNGRQHRTLIDVLEVIGDPIDQLMAKTTKVFLAHVAQFGRKVGFGAVHGGNLTIGSYKTYMTYMSYFILDLRNKRLKAIIP